MKQHTKPASASERKKARTAAASDRRSASASLDERILDSLSEGVMTLDRNWTILGFNRAAEELVGIKREKILGQSFDKAFVATTCEFRPLIERALTKSEPTSEASIVILNCRQERVPVGVNVAPILDSQGRPDGAVASFRDVSDLELLRKELRGEYVFGDIVSRSAGVRRILEILPDIAQSDSTVLILGPSGAGKEVFARAIHNLSERRDKRFVAVNCGALPDSLLESELFGYEKGAFTDARKSKPGRFASAEGGTLFLDEIGDISPAMQVKLLRVLQEREYEPLGGVRPVKADVRILAATNRDLKQRVAEGLFRTDLYYRINVVQIELPPLAERREDLPLLIEHFIRRFNALKGRNVARISRGALNRLLRHDFPGNIRELENIIEHAYILCRGEEIQEACLPPYLMETAGPVCYEEPAPRRIAFGAAALDEKGAVIQALQDAAGNRGRAATALGIDKSTLWRKMKKHEISMER